MLSDAMIDEKIDKVIDYLNSSRMSQEDTDVILGYVETLVSLSRIRMSMLIQESFENRKRNENAYRHTISTNCIEITELLTALSRQHKECEPILRIYDGLKDMYEQEFQMMERVSQQTDSVMNFYK